MIYSGKFTLNLGKVKIPIGPRGAEGASFIRCLWVSTEQPGSLSFLVARRCCGCRHTQPKAGWSVRRHRGQMEGGKAGARGVILDKKMEL